MPNAETPCLRQIQTVTAESSHLASLNPKRIFMLTEFSPVGEHPMYVLTQRAPLQR
jgi:hypothetical protein